MCRLIATVGSKPTTGAMCIKLVKDKDSMNTTQIGDISECKFVLACLKANIPICRPVGNNLPYDFIIEYQGKLVKIQVKSAYKSRSADSITFNTRSVSKNYTGITTKNYVGKIDYFAVVSDLVEYIILVPIEKASKSSMNIYLGTSPLKRHNVATNYKML